MQKMGGMHDPPIERAVRAFQSGGGREWRGTKERADILRQIPSSSPIDLVWATTEFLKIEIGANRGGNARRSQTKEKGSCWIEIDRERIRSIEWLGPGISLLVMRPFYDQQQARRRIQTRVRMHFSSLRCQDPTSHQPHHFFDDPRLAKPLSRIDQTRKSINYPSQPRPKRAQSRWRHQPPAAAVPLPFPPLLPLPLLPSRCPSSSLSAVSSSLG